MKSLIIFAILIAGTFANELCDTEVTRIRTEIDTHVNDADFHFVSIHNKLKSFHDDEITEDEFATFLDGFCPKALDATAFGLEKGSTILEACANYPEFVVKKNIFKFFSVVFGKFCSESGKGYKAIVKNKGTNCFYGNDEYKECFKTHNMKVFAEENFSEDNVCKFVKVNFDCENLLDKCDNHNVKTLQHEINQELKQKMGCTF